MKYVTGIIVLLIVMVFILMFGGWNTASAERDQGEPRTVRLVHLVKYGIEPNQSIADRMKVDIINTQRFYAEQLDYHGYGYKLFNIEMDDDGDPFVHVIKQEGTEHYFATMRANFNTHRNIYFVVYDNGSTNLKGYAGGTAIPEYGDVLKNRGGICVVPTHYKSQAVSHELGHVFGLNHNFFDDSFMMSYGHERTVISECHAMKLAIHPYFNHDISLDSTFLMELMFPSSFPGDIKTDGKYTYADTSIDIVVSIDNPNDIYQVSINAESDQTRGYVFVDCQHGNTDGIFEFYYQGTTIYKGTRRVNGIKYPVTNLEFSESDSHSVRFQIIDVKGNVYVKYMDIKKDLSVLREDLNIDGSVNVLDLIIVSNHIGNGTYTRIADVNQDGIINILDLTRIAQMLGGTP